MEPLFRIQKDVEEIIIHSQEYAFDINCGFLIKDWYEAKRKFYTVFGDKLRIRSKDKIKINLTKEERSKKFSDFLDGLKNNVKISPDFEQFLQENQDGFFDNTVIKGSPQHGIIENSKLLKSFKKFLTEPGIIRYAQDFASQYIQEAKVEGYLYLSVDPRDYLTLSENKANWRSCHSLDGDYRVGNLSYMCDEVTIVTYLADEKDVHYNCLPKDMVWNSKKWRMLVHINNNIIYFNKQYPFNSDHLLSTVLTEINNLYAPTKYFELQLNAYTFMTANSDENTQIPFEHNCLKFFNRPFDMKDILDYKDYRGYADLIYSRSYLPKFAINTNSFDIGKERTKAYKDNLLDEYVRVKNIFGIKIGEKCNCLVCGYEDIERTDKFLCNTCIAELDMDDDNFMRCVECGKHLYPDDEVYFINDEPVCTNCYKSIEEEDHITTEEGD